MNPLTALTLALLTFSPEPLKPGGHARSVQVGEASRSYLLHVPPSYDPEKPTPLVLALHPFATNAAMMAGITGLNETADRHGFLIAYPNGTGWGVMLHWNVGLGVGGEADDVGYLAKVLDDAQEVANVDRKRVYATGFSNGGMMCYRLASEMPDRIAAIAPVAGTMIDPKIQAKRAVSVLHFHGTEDTFVSYNGRLWRHAGEKRLPGVEESVRAWAEHDGCPEKAVTVEVPRKDADDGLSITRTAYGPGRDGSEVVLYQIKGGGHTWPGREPIGGFLGKAAKDLNADELIWEFFEKHPRP